MSGAIHDSYKELTLVKLNEKWCALCQEGVTVEDVNQWFRDAVSASIESIENFNLTFDTACFSPLSFNEYIEG